MDNYENDYDNDIYDNYDDDDYYVLNKIDNVYTYENGDICSHCTWVSQKKPTVRYIPKLTFSHQ